MPIADLKAWVAAEPDPGRRRHKAASHIVLEAIAASPLLRRQMVMKGGMLLAVRYGSERFTRDIDFSTPGKRSDFDEEEFIEALRVSLASVVDELDYGIDCRVQSWEYRPPSDAASFPTLKIKVGFARFGDRAHRRLDEGKSPQTVPIDLSFNEPVGLSEQLLISTDTAIAVYAYAELVAEKFRAILQQEVRNRARRQDAYDLFNLFNRFGPPGDAELADVHRRLVEKARVRGLDLDRNSMDDPDIRARSKTEYPLLAAEVPGELPSFDEVFDRVLAVYRDMPW